MTIKAIKEKYKNYQLGVGERNTFAVYDYNDGNGKIVVVVKIWNNWKDVTQAIRVRDGKEMIEAHRCRPCDNLDDAIDVAGEMMTDL